MSSLKLKNWFRYLLVLEIIFRTQESHIGRMQFTSRNLIFFSFSFVSNHSDSAEVDAEDDNAHENARKHEERQDCLPVVADVGPRFTAFLCLVPGLQYVGAQHLQGAVGITVDAVGLKKDLKMHFKVQYSVYKQLTS
jgi:hypothetical protein